MAKYTQTGHDMQSCSCLVQREKTLESASSRDIRPQTLWHDSQAITLEQIATTVPLGTLPGHMQQGGGLINTRTHKHGKQTADKRVFVKVHKVREDHDDSLG